MEEFFQIKPIGVIHTPFKNASQAPIQPVFAEGAEGIIEVFDEYAAGLRDLAGFERIWVVYWFNRSKKFKLLVTPYMDTQQRGLFATRAPSRPNPIGISAVKLERIDANKICVSDVDMLDGTPLLDIKPYSPKFDSFEVNRLGWLQNADEKKCRADDRFNR